MKRILLLAACMVLGYTTTFAQSADLKLMMTGDPNNLRDSVVIVYGTTADSIITIPMLVINDSSAAQNLKVTRYDSSVVTGSQNYFCWALCYSPSALPNFTGPTPEPVGAGDTDRTYTADYECHGKPGTSILKYTFFNTANANIKEWIIFKFVIVPAGVNEIVNNLHISAPYPNPANDMVSFNYNINGAQQPRLELYNTLGQCVKTFELTSSAGKLNVNVNNIPAGIYICKLTANNGSQPVFQRLVISR